MRVHIIQYSPAKGKGQYRTSDGSIIPFHHTQYASNWFLGLAELKGGKLHQAKNLWQRIRTYLTSIFKEAY